jgi:hypothetical protein
MHLQQLAEEFKRLATEAGVFCNSFYYPASPDCDYNRLVINYANSESEMTSGLWCGCDVFGMNTIDEINEQHNRLMSVLSEFKSCQPAV